MRYGRFEIFFLAAIAQLHHGQNPSNNRKAISPSSPGVHQPT
jgi:hypothetical protein